MADGKGASAPLVAFGNRLRGGMEFVLRPGRGVAWGGPFNGQQARQVLFKRLMAITRPAAIIETGTYLGTTTALLAEAGVPTFTVEFDDRRYGFSRTRFLFRRNVRLIRGDSRQALRTLASEPALASRDRPVFAYLDAHWNADLPLAEEVAIVFEQWPAAVVMIDDFEVPGDPGYTFDDYGGDNVLSERYLAAARARHDLSIYYPSTASGLETGARRGCAVLAKRARWDETLRGLELLRLG